MGRRSFFERESFVGFDISESPVTSLMVMGNGIPNSACTVRRQFCLDAGFVDESFSVIQDYDYWIRICSLDASVKYINRSLGYYWKGTDGISLNFSKYICQYKRLFAKHKHVLGVSEVELSRSLMRLMSAIVLCKNRDWFSALACLEDVSKLKTFRLRLVYWKLKIILMFKAIA